MYALHQGVFEVLVGDMPNCGATEPTPILMCVHNIVEPRPLWDLSLGTEVVVNSE